ncbi:MAG: fumarylacetoacetate hydrolase family protein [Deinococcota bacterium]
MKIACLNYQGKPQWAVEQDGMWLELHQSLDGLLASGHFELSINQATGGPLVPVADVVDGVIDEVISSGQDTNTTTYLPPLQSQEAWASGVTYTRSRDARTRESQGQEVYNRVYDAERPEIFLKASRNRAVGHGGAVGIRQDASWSVPEPELALVLDLKGTIVGYTIGNDMSSRDIEGENPLYLPQAKVYDRCLGLGPVIVTADEIDDPMNLVISLNISRDGETVANGEISTGQLHRKLETLAHYLYRSNRFPHGAILLTGTGIVPDDTFSLQAGDIVTISIESIGTLINSVTTV